MPKKLIRNLILVLSAVAVFSFVHYLRDRCGGNLPKAGGDHKARGLERLQSAAPSKPPARVAEDSVSSSQPMFLDARGLPEGEVSQPERVQPNPIADGIVTEAVTGVPYPVPPESIPAEPDVSNSSDDVSQDTSMDPATGAPFVPSNRDLKRTD